MQKKSLALGVASIAIGWAAVDYHGKMQTNDTFYACYRPIYESLIKGGGPFGVDLRANPEALQAQADQLTDFCMANKGYSVKVPESATCVRTRIPNCYQTS